MKHMVTAVIAASVFGASSVGCGNSSSSGNGGHACTTIACQNGIDVEFSYRDAGTYLFEVTVDGAHVTCTATLPLAQQPPAPCDGPDVQLSLVGSMLPADQQSIGGLTLFSTTAKSVTIRATRDGVLLGDKTFAPPYVTNPGPNGPGCEPEACTFAKVTFP